MSDTAALAAETAWDAPNCGSLSDAGVFSLGKNTSTIPSQNAIRSRKNISRPGGFGSIAVDLAIVLKLTAVHKSQVFALRLNRRKFAENPIDSIRRKYSIDDGFRANRTPRPHPPFRNHTDAVFGNPAFTICIDVSAAIFECSENARPLRTQLTRL